MICGVKLSKENQTQKHRTKMEENTAIKLIISLAFTFLCIYSCFMMIDKKEKLKKIQLLLPKYFAIFNFFFCTRALDIFTFVSYVEKYNIFLYYLLTDECFILLLYIYMLFIFVIDKIRKIDQNVCNLFLRFHFLL